MKTLGIILLFVGAVWAYVAFSSDTTVTSESHYIGNFLVPAQTVHNIGKMDDRRNHLMVSALIIVVGLILFVAGKFIPYASKHGAKTNLGADTRKCPFCAEIVRSEASICRYCHKDLPAAQINATADNAIQKETENTKLEFCFHCGETLRGNEKKCPSCHLPLG